MFVSLKAHIVSCKVQGMQVTESFLQYIWQYKLLKPELYTTEGEAVTLIKPGICNTDAGADFFNARIQIGDTLWAGNVEIHTKSSDWFLHHHEQDPAYSNLILHVVYEYDKPIQTTDGKSIPTLVIKDCIPDEVYQNYLTVFSSTETVRCAYTLRKIHPLYIHHTLERLSVSRLERKTQEIKQYLHAAKNSWSDAFYWLLARYFGGPVNAVPFELLAKSLPLSILAKHKDSLFQIEALLFGQAGMLDTVFSDTYPARLKEEYVFLQKKYGLIPLEKHLWKFFRIRPMQFPTLRISQLAVLIHSSTHLFSVLLETEDTRKLTALFEVKATPYWDTHYLFDKATADKEKTTGKAFIETLLLNVWIPLLFTYGTFYDNELYREKALAFQGAFPAESNYIIEKWKSYGVKVKHASQSQALLELYEQYCKNKQCLKCGIGFRVFNSISTMDYLLETESNEIQQVITKNGIIKL